MCCAENQSETQNGWLPPSWMVARVRSNLDDIPVAVRSVSSDIPPRGESSATVANKTNPHPTTETSILANVCGMRSVAKTNAESWKTKEESKQIEL